MLAARIEKKKHQAAVEALEFGDGGITIEAAIQLFRDATKSSGEFDNICNYMNKLAGKRWNKDTKAFDEVFGFDTKRKLISLGSADIQELILSRKSEGASNSTILHELTYLTQAIKLAKRLKHPIPVIDFAEAKKANRHRPGKSKLRTLTKAEEVSILAQLDPATVIRGVKTGCLTDDYVMAARQDSYDFTVCLFGLGGRYTEVAELPWSDVDLKARTVTLYRFKVENESVFHMTNRMYEVLARRYRDRKSGQVYVFENKVGDGPRNYAPKAFKSACRRAGVKGVSLKTIRKTFASRLVQKGVPLYDVSQLLGHADPLTTQQHYAHLAPNQSAKAATAILNAIDEEKPE